MTDLDDDGDGADDEAEKAAGTDPKDKNSKPVKPAPEGTPVEGVQGVGNNNALRPVVVPQSNTSGAGSGEVDGVLVDSAPAKLAFTGAGIAGIGLLATVLIAAGGVILAARRRVHA